MSLLGFPTSIEALSDKHRQEVLAAMAIEALGNPISLRSLDPGGGAQQLADFEILNSGGDPIGLLEVTTTTRPKRAAFASEQGHLEWSFSRLTWIWTMRVSLDADIRELHRGVEASLLKLEVDGPPDGWRPSSPGLAPDEEGSLPSDLAGLGVVAVSAVSPQDPGKSGWVAVHPDFGGGWYSLQAVAWETQSTVDNEGNQKKLEVPDLERSELFVWLDVGDGQAALGRLTQPPFEEVLRNLTPLALSNGITGVWVASGMAMWPRPISALLFFDGTEWRRIEPPTLNFDDETLRACLVRLTH